MRPEGRTQTGARRIQNAPAQPIADRTLHSANERALPARNKDEIRHRVLRVCRKKRMESRPRTQPLLSAAEASTAERSAKAFAMNSSDVQRPLYCADRTFLRKARICSCSSILPTAEKLVNRRTCSFTVYQPIF